jgi:predicted ribosome quality control (RQC) complex YloA/Tae2 family protein
MQVKEIMSSFDIMAIISELRKIIINKHIDNIYQLNHNRFIFKLKPNGISLLVEIGKRIHLTKYSYEVPLKPSQFCIALRKRLVRGKIVDFYQQDFERIVVLEVSSLNKNYKVFFELFKRGNLILVDSEMKIDLALNYLKMKDRNIIKNEPFKLPPSTGINPLDIKLQDLKKLKDFKNLEVQKSLKSLLAIGDVYTKEILKRANVDFNLESNRLDDINIEKIFEALKQIILSISQGNLSPTIVMDENGDMIDVTPIKLNIYDGYRTKEFQSFNEALDEYFSTKELKLKKLELEKEFEKRIDELKRILKMQEEQLNKLKNSYEGFLKMGETIIKHIDELKYLWNLIEVGKLQGKSIFETIEELKKLGEMGKIPEAYIKAFDPKTMQILISIEGLNFNVNVNENPSKIASRYYQKAKKIKQKIDGLIHSINETKEKLESIKAKSIELLNEEKFIPKKVKREWYEKFRWFNSSEGFLTLIGKDASTNEILIKKYMEPNDIVFHSEFQGSPFVLIKTYGKQPSEKTLQEAAQAAASYSKAWKYGLSSLDVYWVNPNQITKKTPSGEYIKKGAFMIYGQRNYIKGVPLKLAIGLLISEGNNVKVIGGPIEAIKSQTNIYVKIIPGKTKAGKLAKQILSKLSKKYHEIFKKELKGKININEVQNFIPAGLGDIEE